MHNIKYVLLCIVSVHIEKKSVESTCLIILVVLWLVIISHDITS
jgi:hypothetical protein